MHLPTWPFPQCLLEFHFGFSWYFKRDFLIDSQEYIDTRSILQTDRFNELAQMFMKLREVSPIRIFGSMIDFPDIFRFLLKVDTFGSDTSDYIDRKFSAKLDGKHSEISCPIRSPWMDCSRDLTRHISMAKVLYHTSLLWCFKISAPT